MQPFNANDGQIKKAYYAIMRECHPDLSHDEESVEFSTVINEIYEVLSHQGSCCPSLLSHMSISEALCFVDFETP